MVDEQLMDVRLTTKLETTTMFFGITNPIGILTVHITTTEADWRVICAIMTAWICLDNYRFWYDL